jgi:hypothetical protein
MHRGAGRSRTGQSLVAIQHQPEMFRLALVASVAATPLGQIDGLMHCDELRRFGG